MVTITETKEELYSKLDKYFSEAHSSWMFLHNILKRIIEKYYGKWEKECKVDISRTEMAYFHGNPNAAAVSSDVLRTIGLPVEGTQASTGTLKESASVTIRF